ncbi:MAG: family 10 glycosylhydrolase [Candidatus Hydrogenedentes bacterium]|nr:family 10 glycosylhydrolase [Candidatus Hydrogenedentota bacterium]
MFMTWGEGEPAAVASIEIWELVDLPPLELNAAPDGRELGVQYEDPCGTAGAEGAFSHAEWIERVAAYMKYTGQDLLAYPLAWYHGPQFPSGREPSDGLDAIAAPNRVLYGRWTTHPVDWYATLLERFSQEQLSFQGSLTLMRLGSLMQRMNVDLESIRGGADTINNMLWNDQVQSSTNDWTTIYNGLNYGPIQSLIQQQGSIEPYRGGFKDFVYGEKRNPANPMGPIFNPLHPVVQEAIIGFAAEIAERYAKYPAFRGISFNMFASCMPWFGSLRFGYDDLSIKLFEEETGIAAPVDPKAPDRFSKRYAFFTHVCRPAWVAWRCSKIRALFGKIHASVCAARPDLRVTVTLWDETVVPGVLGAAGASHQILARPSNLELFREAGIDPDLYRDLPGLEIDLGMGNPRDRGGHGARPNAGANTPLEEACMYRDFDFLDAPMHTICRELPKPGAFIFNCWVEAWGKHLWARPAAGDPNLETFALRDGAPADGIFRLNSEYPPDGFWWDSQLRITAAFPAGDHFLEPFAHAVAELDACRITRGGLYLDKAHSEALQGFARAYRALPNVKFDTVGSLADPVAVRTVVHGGQRYVYAVNREYYPVQTELRLTGTPAQFRDLVYAETTATGNLLSFTLQAYELRAFVLEPQVEIAGFTAKVPENVEHDLTTAATEFFAAIAAARARGKMATGMDSMEQFVRTALAEGRWAFVRRALSSYIGRKCLALSLEAADEGAATPPAQG